MMISTRAVAFAFTLLAAACTEGSPPAKSPNPNGTPNPATTILQAPAQQSCPLGVQGARVTFDESPAGGMLTFLAAPGQVEELRERARDAAAMHGPNQKVGKGHEGKHGSGGEHGLKAMQLPAVYAAEDDIDGGARIRFSAVEEKDISELRTKLRARAKAMLEGCD